MPLSQTISSTKLNILLPASKSQRPVKLTLASTYTIIDYPILSTPIVLKMHTKHDTQLSFGVLLSSYYNRS